MVCERLLSDCTLKAFAFSGSRTSVITELERQCHVVWAR